MHHRISSTLVALTGVAALAFASPARADLFLEIMETGGPTIVIQDNADPLDLNPEIGEILVDVAALNLEFLNFRFNGLGATSKTPPTPDFTNTPAFLTQFYEVQAAEGGAGGNLVVRASDNDYLFPDLPQKFLGSTAGGTFRNTSSGDSLSFQSFFDPDNTVFAETIASPELNFDLPPPSPMDPLGDFSETAALTPLGTQPIPYALTNTSTLTLNGGQGLVGFSGQTSVTAIPEPASVAMVLFGLGLPIAGRMALRRRNATA